MFRSPSSAGKEQIIRLSPQSGLLFACLILLVAACEDRVWDNPGDPNADIDPEDWKPTNLQAQVLDDSRIKLTWEQTEKRIQGFRIERQRNIAKFHWIAKVDADVFTYIDSGLTYGTNYAYRVQAYTSSNESGYVVSNQTSTSFPAPTNLTATVINDAEIQLEWTDNCSFEEGFRIERQDDGGNWNQIAEVSANVTEYTDSGLNTVDKYYKYRICAFTSTNISDYSNVAGVGTEPVTDIDGNVYQTIQIGDQVWMSENLKVTHYRNGDAIPNVTDSTEWTNLTTGAYCEYGNSSANLDTYGRLYNWYAVNESRNIAPEGWHVPTDEEWKELEMTMGMSQAEADDYSFRGTDQGSQLAGNADLWNDGDLENNADFGSSGFAAPPGGYRIYYGYYSNMRNNGNFWSSTEYGSYNAWYRELNYNSSNVYRYYQTRNYGFAVRCVKD